MYYIFHFFGFNIPSGWRPGNVPNIRCLNPFVVCCHWPRVRYVILNCTTDRKKIQVSSTNFMFLRSCSEDWFFLTIKVLPVSPQREYEHFRGGIPRCNFCCGLSGYHCCQPHCLPGALGLFWSGSILAWRIIGLSTAQLFGDGHTLTLKRSYTNRRILYVNSLIIYVLTLCFCMSLL